MHPADAVAALRPPVRSRLYEGLLDRLAEYVAGAGLRAGDRLPPERELAGRLGVSRASLQQAMVALRVQGLVEARQGDGTYLRTAEGLGEALPELLEKRRRLPEVLEAREALECKLAELAAGRRTEADLEAMESALATMERELEGGALGARGDAAFHEAITAAAHNTVLARLMTGLAAAVRETRLASLAEPGRGRASLAAHRGILAAIRRGDAPGAAAAMAAHLRQVSDIRLIKLEAP